MPFTRAALSRAAARFAGDAAAFWRRWRQHRWAKISVFALVTVLTVAAWGYAWAAKHVTIVVDGVEQSCFSLRLTVAGVLADGGIELGERDLVWPGMQERVVGDDARIEVKRAFAVVIQHDALETPSLTAQATIAAALAEAGVQLGADDRTVPALEDAPQPGMLIRVIRVVKEYEKALWRIPRQITKIQNQDLELGLTQVVAKGKDGVEEVTFCTTYEDGIKLGRKIVGRAVIDAPVPETIIVGTSGTIVRDGQTIRFKQAMSMSATAYYWGPECTGKWADGFTYVGLKAEKGVIAVDPRVIPLWTRVYVDGYGFAIAGDVGSAIKGSKIDLCYDTYAEALQWGKRPVRLYILW